jgi:hypothetical protein
MAQSSPFESWGGFSDWSFPTAEQCSMTDLSRQFNTTCTLDRRPLPPPRSTSASPLHQQCYPQPEETTSSRDVTLSPTVSASSSTFNECTSINIRRQRQRAVRDQCTSSHLEAIALMARMIDNGDQCEVNNTSTSSIDSVESEDAPLSPISPITRCRTESFASYASSDRRTSVATSIASSSGVGRRSTENRVKKIGSGRPRSGTAVAARPRTLKEERVIERMKENYLI